MAGKTNDQQELIRELNGAWGLSMGEYLSGAELEELLSERLNTLIREDFAGLVRLLYRIDIDETKLKQLLQVGQGVDAGRIIARLIVDRQLQKIATRKNYANRKSSDPAGEKDCGEEKW